MGIDHVVIQAAEQRAEELLFRMPLYRDMTERRTELSDHRRRDPYANRKIHESMYVQQMVLLNYRGILIESVIDADEDNIGKEKNVWSIAQPLREQRSRRSFS